MLLQHMNNNYKQNNSVIKQEANHFIKPIDIINQFKQNKVGSSHNNIEIRSKKYITQIIDQTNRCYDGSSISQNENYLAYGGEDISYQKYMTQIKKKKLKNKNQRKIFWFANLLWILNIYMLDYYQDMHMDIINLIYDIITIQNDYLITCSFDRSIIKTDIQSKQQIFKLTGHTGQIRAIDYNQQDEIIVSGSNDQSIKLWDCRKQSVIIDKERSHNQVIRQIQLINNNLNILSLDWDGILYKWNIDLMHKDLIKLQQFSDQNIIYNFYQVNQDQNLLLICQNYVKILNNQGETINTIEHCGKDRYSTYDCRQLDNLKYIQIRTGDKILLAIAQD